MSDGLPTRPRGMWSVRLRGVLQRHETASSRRRRVARRHRVDADAVRRQLQAAGADERDQPGLGGAVDRVVGRPGHPRHRRDERHRPARPEVAHRLAGDLHGEEGVAEALVELEVVDLVGDVEQWRPLGDADDVRQPVEPPGLLDGLGDDPFDVLPLGHVTDLGDAAGLGGDRRRPLLDDVDADDGAPDRRDGVGHLPADAEAAADDDDRLAVEAQQVGVARHRVPVGRRVRGLVGGHGAPFLMWGGPWSGAARRSRSRRPHGPTRPPAILGRHAPRRIGRRPPARRRLRSRRGRALPVGRSRRRGAPPARHVGDGAGPGRRPPAPRRERAVGADHLRTATGDLGRRGEPAGRTFEVWRDGVRIDEAPAAVGAHAATVAGPDGGAVHVYLPEGMRPEIVGVDGVGGDLEPTAARPALGVLRRLDHRGLGRVGSGDELGGDRRSNDGSRRLEHGLRRSRPWRGGVGRARRVAPGRPHHAFLRDELLGPDAPPCRRAGRRRHAVPAHRALREPRRAAARRVPGDPSGRRDDPERGRRHARGPAGGARGRRPLGGERRTPT